MFCFGRTFMKSIAFRKKFDDIFFKKKTGIKPVFRRIFFLNYTKAASAVIVMFSALLTGQFCFASLTHS